MKVKKRSDSPKVGILQNQFVFGGRIKVIIHIIEVLNEYGIIPDLISMDFRFKSMKELQNKYQCNVSCNIKRIFCNIRLPYEWRIIFFNLISRFYLKKYDIIINSNNTSFLLPKKKYVISYVHFPRKAQLRNLALHRKKNHINNIINLRKDLFNIARFLYMFDNHFNSDNILIANSNFTKENILRYYKLINHDIKIIYPPVELNPTPNAPNKTESVVTLGRFAPIKRQLDQIKIAQQLPSLNFKLIGFVSDTQYFQECRQYIQSQNITNVQLFTNCSYSEVQTILSQSKYFLHSKVNEPFGITTVEAINNGCIPIVNNSGGQKEIVPIETLRFNTINEAVSIIKNITQWDNKQIEETSEYLNKHIQKFSLDNFKKQFRVLVQNIYKYE